MPLWHCPHCGTPQAEAARCWVCRKSSTSCVTCRHFRRGVAGGLGYCGLDRQRDPRRGDEIRACWEPSTPVSLGLGAGTAEARETARAPLAWHDVTGPAGPSGPLAVGDDGLRTPPPAPAGTPAPLLGASGGFWGDLEP